MATLCSDVLDLPAEGSSYFAYLCSIPIGARMRVELSPEPPGTLSESEEQEFFFTVTRVGDDGWIGVKGAADDVVSSTAELYSHVRSVLAEDEEDVIRVFHGHDPLKVKREMVEQGAAEHQFTFHTLNKVIELNSDTEEQDGARAGVGARASMPAGQARYESVMLSLKDPPPNQAEARASVPAPAPAPDSAPAATAAIKNIMVLGQRIKIAFKSMMTDDTTAGMQWFGGLVIVGPRTLPGH